MATNQVIDAGFNYVRVHTQHAMFTFCCIFLAALGFYKYILPNLMTKAEGAELSQSVGRIELYVTEDRIEKKQKELLELLESGDEGHAAQKLKLKLNNEIGTLKRHLEDLEERVVQGNSNTKGH